MLNKITQHGLTISAQNTKGMAFRSEIVIDKKIIEKINSFNCLGNLKSYETVAGNNNELNNYLKTTGIINNLFYHIKLQSKQE